MTLVLPTKVAWGMADDPGGTEKPKLPGDEDIAARFERIRDQLKRLDLPELPEDEIERIQKQATGPKFAQDDVESKLTELESRAQHAKGQFQTAINRPSPKSLDESNRSSRGLAFGMMIAYMIMGLPMAGVGIGALIDWRLGTVMGKGIGVLAGAVLGVTMAIRVINENANKPS
jgi:F0F1-type ATP synthase assembly protein I